MALLVGVAALTASPPVALVEIVAAGAAWGAVGAAAVAVGTGAVVLAARVRPTPAASS